MQSIEQLQHHIDILLALELNALAELLADKLYLLLEEN